MRERVNVRTASHEPIQSSDSMPGLTQRLEVPSTVAGETLLGAPKLDLYHFLRAFAICASSLVGAGFFWLYRGRPKLLAMIHDALMGFVRMHIL